MSGWKDWAIGEVVTESEFQSFVQDQVVQVYDDATDRDNTLGANVTEGMVCYLKDVNETQVYDGTDWVQVGEGDITGVTAGDGLTGGGTSGDVSLDVDMTYINSNASIEQSQVTDLVSDLSNKASTTHASTHESGGTDEIEIAQSQVTGLDAGTEGFTAVSNGTAGLSYQPVSHNYIINGAFDIWQRGDGPFTTDGDITADRWTGVDGVGAYSISKGTFAPGEIEAIGFGDASNYLAFEQTTAGSFTNVNTKLEDVRTLAGQAVTLSFWAKGTGTEEQILIQQNFGSGGSATEQVGSGVFALTSTWTRYEFTLTLPSVSGKTIGTSSFLQVYIRNRAFETYTLDLWGVQLEAGSIATPFKRNANSIAGEKLTCLRYYRRLTYGNSRVLDNATAYSTTLAFSAITFPVEMRAIPSIEASGTDIFRFLAAGAGYDSTDYDSLLARENSTNFYMYTSGLTIGQGGWMRIEGVDGWLEFDAEIK